VNDFTEKVALVTGSSRGIGRAIALELARRGASLVVNYRKREDEASQTVRDAVAAGGRAIAVQANVAVPDDIERLFAALCREYGGVDFLVCNAAAGMQGMLAETTLKAWDLAMNVNARSFLLCAQLALPIMKGRGGGRILATTARIATERAFPHYGSVAASKAAINTLTAYLAVEFAPHGITVNALSPGVVDTEALAYFREGAAILQRARERTPTGRVTAPEDVARLAAFLCSEEASMITGVALEVDGGRCI
jgi:enoyl-[acyl-carrier protein] reductase III